MLFNTSDPVSQVFTAGGIRPKKLTEEPQLSIHKLIILKQKQFSIPPWSHSNP